MLSPDFGQGYLVLNKAENPNVKTWVVKVNTRTFDQNNLPQDKTLDKVVLKNNINYWQVPETLLESDKLRFLEITGLDNSDNTLVSEGPIIVSAHPTEALEPGGDVFVPSCKWVCNGSYYAWEIQQYVDGTQPTVGPSLFEVGEALNFNTSTQMATPNYRYITQQEYDGSAVCGSNQSYILYDVPCVDITGIWMTDQISVPQGSTAYKDMNGNVIPGPAIVRGVGKPLGDWDNGNPIVTPEFQFGTNLCSNDRYWANSVLND